MFDRILVPWDSRTDGVVATEVAYHLARRYGSRMMVLRMESVFTSPEQAHADDQAMARRVQQLRHRGVDIQYRLEFGRLNKAVEELEKESHVELEEARRPRLIVMAQRYVPRFGIIWHPSGAARLLGHGSTPILVWPEREPEQFYADVLPIAGSLVLVPLDGSELAEQALPYAAAFAQKYARTLMLIRVIPAPSGTGPRTTHVWMEHQARAEREAHAYLSATRRHVSQQYDGLCVQSMLLSGDPGRALLRCLESHDGGLAIMTTHGHGGAGHAILGGVAARLVRETPRPLLIVPPGAGLSDHGIMEPVLHSLVAHRM